MHFGFFVVVIEKKSHGNKKNGMVFKQVIAHNSVGSCKGMLHYMSIK